MSDDPPRKTLSDGTQIYPEHTSLKANGQQEGYIVLAEEERAKGFIRPLRDTYRHLVCGGTTTVYSRTIVETLARDPYFYNGTFCCHCRKHLPIGKDGEFVWSGTDIKVGT